MSAEFWAIIGVGVALGGLHWRMLTRIDARMDGLNARMDALEGRLNDMDRRLARVEATLDLLVKGLHIEISGRGGTPTTH